MNRASASIAFFLRFNLAVAALAGSAASLWAQAEDAPALPYVIESYDVTITMQKTDTVEVEERIDVLFNEPRRGIFRVIPVDYPTDSWRGRRRVALSGISVTDEDDQPITTKTTREGANMRIRMGDADVFLQPGTRKTYVIRYKAVGALNWFDRPDGWAGQGGAVELYWNVIGPEWDTTIQAASFRIVYPEEQKEGILRGRVFAGAYGSRDSLDVDRDNRSAAREVDATQITLSDNDFTGNRAAPLPPYNGLTVVLQLPEGAVQKPSWTTVVLRTIQANMGFGIPILVFLGMFLVWLRHGRDAQSGPIAVQFEPPDGLTGPECGTILDEKVDTRDIVSGLVELAVKGYLTFHPREEGLVFKKRTADMRLTGKEADASLNEFQRSLLSLLKQCGELVTSSDLSTHVAPSIHTLKGSLYNLMVRHGYYKKNPNSVRGWWVFGSIVVVGVLGFLALVITGELLPSIIGGVLGVIIAIPFAMQMPKRTKAGTVAHRNVRGFEEFIRRARLNELDWMQKKQPDALMFEEYLPHAVAFGLVSEWSRAFDDIVKEPPSWYHHSGHYGHFYLHDFASDMNDIGRSVGSAATTPPRSSGSSGGSSGFSSGGGFSGGGFGGGGGGSW